MLPPHTCSCSSLRIDDTIQQLDDHLADVYHEAWMIERRDLPQNQSSIANRTWIRGSVVPQVDCTRIALDPRFKNMEGSIGVSASRASWGH